MQQTEEEKGVMTVDDVAAGRKDGKGEKKKKKKKGRTFWMMGSPRWA